MDGDPSEQLNWWRRRNWWKIGFFVMLIAFELTRETAIIASNSTPTMLVSKSIQASEGWIHAEGRWRRIDGGSELLPNIVSIDCDQSKGVCSELSVVLLDKSVTPPERATYPAEFTRHGVSYSNTLGCVRYDVSIDTGAEQASSVRRLRPASEQSNPTLCSGIEKRLETVLADGYGQKFGDYDLPSESFLPLFRTIRWIVGNR